MRLSKFSEKINPLIGVDRGNCLCGPYLPFSIARPGPDCSVPHKKTTGYCSDDPIIRFSNTHVQGTGGASRFGNIGITPFTGKIRICAPEYGKKDEKASVGYYSVVLEPEEIKVELSATYQCAIHRYAFSSGKSANLTIDAGAVIQTRHEPGVTGMSTGGFIEKISPFEIVGRADFKGGWNKAKQYSIYFFVVLSETIMECRSANFAGSWDGQGYAHGPNSKLILGFGEIPSIELRVGISFTSIANARDAVQKECAKKTFEQIIKSAKFAWEKELSQIELEGGDSTVEEIFRTMQYRLLCMPSDLGVDHENPLWKSGVRQFSEFYCLWDSVRNANALLTLLKPSLEVDFLNACLDIAEHTGWLPDAWIGFRHGPSQGGNSVNIMFAEAALKDLPGIDYRRALDLMLREAETDSPDIEHLGRTVSDYKRLGYVLGNPSGVWRSAVSKHIEYSYQDWAIAQVAVKLGEKKIAAEYLKRSRKLWKLWDANTKTFAPKLADGSWAQDYDPDKYAATQSWNDPYFYEGTGRRWSFCAFQNFPELVSRKGGNEAFIKELDELFDNGKYRQKETFLHIPYLYHYAGRPDKSSLRVNQLIRSQYSTSRDGLPDDEDMGAHSAWFICSCMGIYPVMGQNLFLIVAPIFREIRIRLENGKCLEIVSPAFSVKKRIVESAEFNGRKLQDMSIPHTLLSKGGTLKLKTKEILK